MFIHLMLPKMYNTNIEVMREREREREDFLFDQPNN